MKVHAIYDRENKFVAAFPDRDSAESFGMEVLGITNGWQYSIVEKYLHEYPTLFSTTPYTTTIPCTQPTPYEPKETNIPKRYYDNR